MYTDYVQFAGHTQYEHPLYVSKFYREKYVESEKITKNPDNIVLVDCLGHSTESVIYDPDNNTIEINKETKNK